MHQISHTDPQQKISAFFIQLMQLSTWKYNPGCLLRILDLEYIIQDPDLYPSRIQILNTGCKIIHIGRMRRRRRRWCPTPSPTTSSTPQVRNFFFVFWYFIQHCFICRLSDFTVSEDAGIKPRTVPTLSLAVTRSNRSHHLQSNIYSIIWERPQRIRDGDKNNTS